MIAAMAATKIKKASSSAGVGSGMCGGMFWLRKPNGLRINRAATKNRQRFTDRERIFKLLKHGFVCCADSFRHVVDPNINLVASRNRRRPFWRVIAKDARAQHFKRLLAEQRRHLKFAVRRFGPTRDAHNFVPALYRVLDEKSPKQHVTSKRAVEIDSDSGRAVRRH